MLVVLCAFIYASYFFIMKMIIFCRPLIGCIYEVKINEKVLLWPEVIESHGVDIGLCDLTSVCLYLHDC